MLPLVENPCQTCMDSEMLSYFFIPLVKLETFKVSKNLFMFPMNFAVSSARPPLVSVSALLTDLLKPV